MASHAKGIDLQPEIILPYSYSHIILQCPEFKMPTKTPPLASYHLFSQPPERISDSNFRSRRSGG